MTQKLKVPVRVYRSMENEYKRAARAAEDALGKAEQKKAILDMMEIDTGAIPTPTTESSSMTGVSG